MNVYAWILVALSFVSVIVEVTQVGKPRKPVTPGVAAATVVVNTAYAALVVLAATR